MWHSGRLLAILNLYLNSRTDDALLFGVIEEPGSVPAHVSLVDLGGEWAVDWTWGDGRPPSAEPILPPFANIAVRDPVRPLVADALEESPDKLPVSAVLTMGFVQRFGTLSLCRDHRRPLDTAEHKSCERLKPEPALLPADPFAAGKAMELACHVKLDIELVARRCLPELLFNKPVSDETKEQVKADLEKGMNAVSLIC